MKTKIIISPRQTGKTTKCIKLLKKHKNAIYYTFNESHKGNLIKKYPLLKERIRSINNDLEKDKEIIIDEPDLMDANKLMELISQNDIIFMAGTPDHYNLHAFYKLSKANVRKNRVYNKIYKSFKVLKNAKLLEKYLGGWK